MNPGPNSDSGRRFRHGSRAANPKNNGQRGSKPTRDTSPGSRPGPCPKLRGPVQYLAGSRPPQLGDISLRKGGKRRRVRNVYIQVIQRVEETAKRGSKYLHIGLVSRSGALSASFLKVSAPNLRSGTSPPVKAFPTPAAVTMDCNSAQSAGLKSPALELSVVLLDWVGVGAAVLVVACAGGVATVLLLAGVSEASTVPLPVEATLSLVPPPQATRKAMRASAIKSRSYARHRNESPFGVSKTKNRLDSMVQDFGNHHRHIKCDIRAGGSRRIRQVAAITFG